MQALGRGEGMSQQLELQKNVDTNSHHLYVRIDITLDFWRNENGCTRKTLCRPPKKKIQRDNTSKTLESQRAMISTHTHGNDRDGCNGDKAKRERKKGCFKTIYSRGKSSGDAAVAVGGWIGIRRLRVRLTVAAALFVVIARLAGSWVWFLRFP